MIHSMWVLWIPLRYSVRYWWNHPWKRQHSGLSALHLHLLPRRCCISSVAWDAAKFVSILNSTVIMSVDLSTYRSIYVYGDSCYDDDDAVAVLRAYHGRGLPIKSSSAAFWYRRPLSWGTGYFCIKVSAAYFCRDMNQWMTFVICILIAYMIIHSYKYTETHIQSLNQ